MMKCLARLGANFLDSMPALADYDAFLAITLHIDSGINLLKIRRFGYGEGA